MVSIGEKLREYDRKWHSRAYAIWYQSHGESVPTWALDINNPPPDHPSRKKPETVERIAVTRAAEIRQNLDLQESLGEELKKRYSGQDLDPNDGLLFGVGSPLLGCLVIKGQSNRVVIVDLANKLLEQYRKLPVTDSQNIPKIISEGIRGKREQGRLVEAAKKLFGWLHPDQKSREDFAAVAQNIKIPLIWNDPRFPKERLNDSQKAAIQRLVGFLVLHPEQSVYLTEGFPVEMKLIFQETGLNSFMAIKIARMYIAVLQERIENGERFI